VFADSATAQPREIFVPPPLPEARRDAKKGIRRRYQSASELAGELHAFKQGTSSTSLQTPQGLPTPAGGRLWARFLLLLVLIFAATGVYASKRGILPRFTPGTPASQGTTARSSLAVLGFENLTERPEHQWLLDGFF
jgi:hypothetical protein